MANIIHICFSESAGGSLKYAIRKKQLLEGNKVIVFSDDISQGIIGNGINIGERINWWQEINREDENFTSDMEFIRKGYKKFYNEISKINASDVVYLWYGHCSNEICGMMYTLELLKDKLTSMYFINVSDLVTEYSNGVYIPLCLAEIMPEKLNQYMEVKRKIELKEYDALLNQWNLLKKDNAMLRIFKQGKVESVNENYFDIDILKYTEKNFKKSARIVGIVMGYSETRISDSYIFWRVKELIKSGEIEYEGTFGIMKEMEVKITAKGIDYLSRNEEAMEFWNSRAEKIDVEAEMIQNAKQSGRLEEKISIAKKLIDVLQVEIIAEKTGLTIEQVTNLKL